MCIIIFVQKICPTNCGMSINEIGSWSSEMDQPLEQTERDLLNDKQN
jgi:hypothetical protein